MLLRFSSTVVFMNSLVLRGEQVDGPLLSGFAPVRLVHLHHLLDTETQTLEERGEVGITRKDLSVSTH